MFRLRVADSAAAATSAVFRLTVDQPRDIPFAETFESGGAIPSGWTQEFVHQSVAWTFEAGGAEAVPASAHGGTYNALFYSGRTSNDTTRLVSPMLDFGSSATNAQLTFWHCMANRSGSQDQLRIYYRTNATASWVQLSAYTSDTGAWTQRTNALPNLSRTYFLAFEGLASSGYGVCVDDLAVTAESAPPTIQTGTTLPPGVEGVAYSTNFTASGGALPYTWSIASNALPPGLTLTSAGALTGTPTTATSAYFRVRVAGGNGKASTNLFSLTVQGRRPLPFAETFENGGAIPSGWSQDYVTNATSWAFQSGGYNFHPTNAHGGTYNAYLFVKSRSPSVTRLISPPLDCGAATTNAVLSFWHCMPYWNPDQDELRLYYKSSSTSSWTLFAAFTTNTAVWAQRTLALPSPSRTYWIAFEGTAKYGYGVCVDDVSVIAPGSPHGAWTTNHFTFAEIAAGAVTGDRADPDGDGIPNLLEYALGLDPRAADTNGVPTGGLLGGYLTLNYRQNKQATDLVYLPQACTNLADAAWSTNNLSQVSRADSNAWWSVTVRHDTPITNAPARFMRLRVDAP